MSNPYYNSNLPVDGSEIVAGELRGQFCGLANQITDTFTMSANSVDQVAALGLTVSNPPTQAQVQAVADKLDELLTALKRV